MIRRMRRSPLFAVLLGSIVSCTTPDAPPPVAAPTEPYVVVLGTAQDGGLPHIGCFTGNCAAAREDPTRRRLVTSLLLCDPRDGRRWLFDCTPDLRLQLDLIRDEPATRAALQAGAAARPPLFEGLFLTHAHMGHYGGLLQLGREAYAVKSLPTFVTPRFAAFLRDNGPWKLMVDEQRLLLNELIFDARIELAPDLHVTAFRVPHRDEFSDTVGFKIDGPHRSLVYLPDIDKWEKWDGWAPDGDASAARRIEDVIAGCDLALLDGCFFADGEIAGRTIKEIPHPFIAESIARFTALPRATREKVFFTHLNHTNPAADPDGEAARAVIAAGMHVLSDGKHFGL